MKAIVRDRYGAPDTLRCEDIPTPTPGPGEVLVAVHRSSVNTADLDQLFGRPRIARLGTGLSRPRTRLGLDLAGVVESVGDGVTRFKAGDRVWADVFSNGAGAFAEYVCAREKAFVPLPEGVSMSQAATIPHSGLLAKQGLEVRGGVRPGDRVLINGAGGCVGPFAIQIAKHRGAHVTGVDHASKLDFVKIVGADVVVDYTTEDFTRPGGQFDYILDIAARRTLLSHRRALTPHGTYVQIARTLGGFFRAAMFGGLLSLTSKKRLGLFMWEGNRERDLIELAGLVADGKIETIIDRELSLDEVPEAMSYLAAGHARGKLVVNVASEKSADG
ncbi:MAG TPA: NAD(P)-dependent alcohol dehydrogenase [Acidimicrobiia bacterium]|nr:NAD(P)-dependent alcohol dehydrogenase [Acidimicrobiia bacterium]